MIRSIRDRHILIQFNSIGTYKQTLQLQGLFQFKRIKPMDVAIISGLISAGAAIIVCLINNHYQRIEADKKHETQMALIEYKIEELRKAVEKHNSIVERTYELEKKAEVTEEQIKVANHRLDDLERVDDRK